MLKVEAEIVTDKILDKEYLPIDEYDVFNKGARMAIFKWESPHINSDKVGTIQTLSRTGALRIPADFFRKFKSATLFESNPTWVN